MQQVPSASTLLVCGFLLLRFPAHTGCSGAESSDTQITAILDCPLKVLELLKEGRTISQDHTLQAWTKLSETAREHAEAFIISLAATVEQDTLAAHEQWMLSGNKNQSGNPLYSRWEKKALRNQQIRNLASKLGITICPWSRKRTWNTSQ
jgi:hypothetical protein